ncbi:isoniazid-induced dynamin-like GTPase IniA [Pseudonocardia eucalypti]|uniref:Isoniazid-induced dynamin-like GTPase IniA n=1 Tax=Pseudonocardia eucalypti TaxID=648755 RepID=A0ABP9PE26_9PSEU|nr:ubiquinone biosynthesis protein UbiJ [Pseudonocardia eucalypti]
MALPDAVALVELALKATAAYKRPDLARRLQQIRVRLLDPNVRVLVVGEFKQGKSQLVNALVNAPVCPVDDDIATAIPTAVRYAETASVTLVRESESDSGEPLPAQRTEVPVDQLAQYVSEAGNPGNRQQLTYAEVGIPRKLLQGGMVLVDTPGVGGLGSAHGAATMAALPKADAVLLVSDAAQEYTAPELDFLESARQLCPNVACVVTKTDLYPHWRRIVELNHGHLRRVGDSSVAGAPVFPVSSTLRLHALRGEDSAMMQESGYVELIQFLQRDVVARSDELDRRSTSQAVVAVAEQISTAFSSELMTLEDPHKAAELMDQLKRAKAAADDLKQRSARWNITLNDGVGDLNSDVEYDLRDRLRAVSREAERIAESSDPKDTWDQLVSWTEQQVSQAATQNFVWAIQRAQYLAQQVADHFSSNAVLPDLSFGQNDFSSGELRNMEKPELEVMGVGNKLFSGLRGGYGGMVMVGMATGLAGMSLLNPLSAAAGLAFGGKTVADELKRNKQRRQSDAKMAVRKYIDDVTFQMGKDTRDMLRQVQRTLRDHFSQVAEEMSTSLAEAVSSAGSAVKMDETQRVARIRDLKAELERIENMAQRARGLAGAAGAGTNALAASSRAGAL